MYFSLAFSVSITLPFALLIEHFRRYNFWAGRVTRTRKLYSTWFGWNLAKWHHGCTNNPFLKKAASSSPVEQGALSGEPSHDCLWDKQDRADTATAWLQGRWVLTYLQSHGLELLHCAYPYTCLLQGGMQHCFGLIKSTKSFTTARLLESSPEKGSKKPTPWGCLMEPPAGFLYVFPSEKQRSSQVSHYNKGKGDLPWEGGIRRIQIITWVIIKGLESTRTVWRHNLPPSRLIQCVQ